MGRKMSSQRKPNLEAYRGNVQNWFHEDDGTVSPTGLPPARPSKKSFEEEVSFARHLLKAIEVKKRSFGRQCLAWYSAKDVVSRRALLCPT